MTRKTVPFILALATACAAAPADPGDKGLDDVTGGKEDRWDWRGSPERFDGEFDYHLEDLPLGGTAERESWASTYWPTYEDSINARWTSGELSPAQKYDQAFNGWMPTDEFLALRPFDRSRAVTPGEDWDTEYYEQQGPLASHISNSMGNGRDRQMAIDAGGRPEGDWDVETWWGLCHAWVPAALLEDRPQRSVTYNGVEFHVGDLEALLIAAYNRAPADMIGGRCNVGSGDTEVERDEHGRAVDVECRDSNPGALHVIVTNYLGMQSRGFAFDKTADYEVWNQPVIGYEVTKQEEIDLARANELLGLTGDSYAYNDDAAFLYEVGLSVKWVTESSASKTPANTNRYTRTSRYTYILEVDADGKIIGGEWTGSSRNDHPDFLWNPRRLTRSSVPNLDIDDVRMLVEMSRAPEVPVSPADALVAEGQGGIAIPDNESMGIQSVATITGGTGVVSSVGVDLTITHTYAGDLLVELEHGGVRRTVHNREGGSDDDVRGHFDLVGFEGVDPNGAWTLHVSDNAGQDLGTLERWTLTLGTEDGTPVTPTEPTTERFPGEGGVDIPDNDPNGAASVATVTATEGTVTIEAAITHTYVGDLEVTVAHGDRTWTLHSREGGGDDDLSLSVPLDATGDAFEGDPSGEWVLTVVDNANIDTGSIASWAVVVTH
ncbi:MAG: proprotein convertase P-domain-containing protein [Deltaproteobacteria bacterium]|nr:proprotein convertase P-domain-containing protein [Deltaproteobacteria bacterium]